MKMTIRKLLGVYSILTLTLFVAGCGGDAGTVVGNPTTASTDAYPTSLAIASPVDSSGDSSSSVSAFLSAGRPLYATSFTDSQDAINTMLNGTTLEDCEFDVTPLTEDTEDANCYGPEVDYTGNPDGSLPNSGTLPPGDVGIWTATNTNEDGDEEACAVAELNTLIEGANNKAGTAMYALASMLCVASVEEIELTGTVDLTSLMTDMVTATSMDASFTSAVITVSTDATTSNTIYSYALVFTAEQADDDVEVIVNMQHMPENSDNTVNRGNFNYRFSQSLGTSSNCGLTGQTSAGSVQYQQTATTELKFKADSARYCGTDTNPFTASDYIDPTDTYQLSTNDNGWSDDWNSFIATLDPTTTEGEYAYFWQAGRNDVNSRVFNLILATDNMATAAYNSDDVLAGNAYFGYGPSVDDEDADGRILGFIGNWTGPGNTKTVLDFVQHQEISADDTGLFTANVSQITYAPTNTCNYRSTDSGFGSFRYDADGSGSIDAGDPLATTEITNDLLTVTDADSDDYLDEIAISLPVEIEGI